MSSRVYSTLFLSVGSESINAGYVVAAGDTAVVRDIYVVIPAEETNVAWFVSGEGGAGLIAYGNMSTRYQEWHWTGRQVVNGGNEINAVSNGPAVVYLRCSGYLLSPS